MAKKENPDVLKWQNRLEHSRKWRDEIAKKAGWDRFIDEYRFIWPMLEGKLPFNVAPINLIYAYVKTEVPALYFRDPYIAVNPRKMTTVLQARVQQEALNAKWRAKRLKQEIKRSIIHGLLVGHSWIKNGFTVSTATVEGSDEKKDARTPALEVDERITNEDIFGYHMNWDEVLFSPDARHANEDARWMAYRWAKPTEALRKSKRFQNTKDLRASFTVFGSKMTRRDLDPGDIEMTLGWEIWDKDSGEKFALAEGHGEFVQEPIEWPYPFDDFPASMLSFAEDPKSPYPLSTIGPWEKQVLEKIKIRAMEINHIKRWNRQGFVTKGVLSKAEKDKYLNNVDGTLIEARSKNLGAEFFFPQYPNFQSDAYVVEDRIDQDIRNVNGQPETRRSASMSTKTRTLGELTMINEWAQAQSNEREDLVEDFCEDIAGKQLALMKEFFDMDHAAELVDPLDPEMAQEFERLFNEGKEERRFFGTSFLFSKRDLQGDTDVEVKAGTTLPMNRQTRQQILGNVISSTAQYLHPTVLSAIVREYLREYDMKVIDKAFVDAEKEQKVQRIVQESLGAERQGIRDASVQARNLGLAAGDGGAEVPEIPQ